MTVKLKIRKGDDFHCHFRTGPVLEDVAFFTARQFKRAIIMPNTNPPILTARDVNRYRREILELVPWFEPLMTIQINDNTTPRMAEQAKESGAIAGKIYPLGVTTNSQNGVSNFKAIYPTLDKMQEIGMLALFHGEDPWEKATCLDREKMFLPTLYGIANDFPRLKIVLEHITTADAIQMVEQLPNVAATITAHHLLLTIDDIIGDKICPHNFCKPIAKRPEDREALLKAATSGNPKFFFGSDSAPHLKQNKECSHGCAGIFTAPNAIQSLAQTFEERSALRFLDDFVSGFGAYHYGLPRSQDTIQLVKKDWTVGNVYNGIVPFRAGQVLHWQVVT